MVERVRKLVNDGNLAEVAPKFQCEELPQAGRELQVRIQWAIDLTESIDLAKDGEAEALISYLNQQEILQLRWNCICPKEESLMMYIFTLQWQR